MYRAVLNYRKSLRADDIAMLRSWDTQEANENLQTKSSLPSTQSFPIIYQAVQDSDGDVTVREAIVATMATDYTPKAKHIDPTHSLLKDGAELFNKKAPQESQKQQDDLSGVAVVSTVGAVMKPQPTKKESFWRRMLPHKKSSDLTTSINQSTEKIGKLCKVSGTQLFLFSMPSLADINPEDWSPANIERVKTAAERYLANERTSVNNQLLATNLVGFRRVREERMHLAIHQRFPVHIVELPATTINPPELDTINPTPMAMLMRRTTPIFHD